METDTSFQVIYPFHYKYVKNSYLIVYDDTLLNHHPSDSSWIPINTFFVSGVGEKYAETLDKSKFDTVDFFYPGTENIYCRLSFHEKIANLTFFDHSGKQIKRYNYDKGVTDYKIIYNEIWTSPPYPPYNRLTIIKTKR
jgi:hypothetical protein